LYSGICVTGEHEQTMSSGKHNVRGWRGKRRCGVSRKKNCKPASTRNAGFSFLALVTAITVTVILAAVAIPQVVTMLRTYRMVDDTRSIAAQLSLARMRAASRDEPARMSLNLVTNTYQIQICTSVPASLCNQGGATYTAEGGTQYLSQGVTFGFGGVTIPAGGQTSIAETTQITFNSRGISVDGSGNPIGTAAIYIVNGQGFLCAVTVSIGGQVTEQRYTGGTSGQWVTL
jgi:Tfp pilus assembly protein FimT